MPRFLFLGDKRMNPSTGRRKPRLERRNASKNFDYDAASFSSSTDEATSCSSSLRTRSLEISDRTSFRIEGNDGEIDRICRSLGLTGIEDFAIPADAWEARKIRSSKDLTPRSSLDQWSSPKQDSEGAAVELKRDPSVESSKANEAVVVKQSRVRRTDARDCLGVRETADLALRESTELAPLTASTPFFTAPREAVGIKGDRPPFLKPPPLMRIQAMDNEGSTWDILRSFAPEGERESEGFAPSSNAAEEEKVEPPEIKPTDVEDEEEEESGSFTASNDDSSSSATEPTSISPNMRYRTISNWMKGELLGRGSFGSVYEGIAEDGFFFAIKEVSLLDQGEQGRQSIFQLEQEIALLSQFEHENIVQYYGTDKDDSNLYIFLEFVTKGSLQSLYRRYHLRESTVAAYTRQILHGLKYLHDRNVVHRDIKCANILVDANGSVKLADFGLAKATKLNDVQSCKGTACWMAPEVIKKSKDKGYGLPADIWSLGCTVLEMLTREIPYSELEPMQAIYRIGKGELPTIPDILSMEAQDFIWKCLQVNPNDRPTAARLLDHSFVKRPLSSTPSASPSPYYISRRSM